MFGLHLSRLLVGVVIMFFLLTIFPGSVGCIPFIISHVFATFMKFKSLAENYFSYSIKQLQTDKGGEFLSNQFKEFLSEHGIFYRLTCPHTSQQNGIAEWKHCHI